MNLDLRQRFELRGAAEGFAQNFLLDFKLMFVVGMLIMAAPAAREIRAGGRNALGRRLDNRFGVGACESRLLLFDRGFDFFASQNKGQESRLAAAALVGGKVRKAVATVNHLFNGEKQGVILNEDSERPACGRA